MLLITHYTRILRYITARLRPRLRRRPDRRAGRPRARRAARGRGLRQVRQGCRTVMTDTTVRPSASASDPTRPTGTTSTRVRADFPILSRVLADDRPLVYLDSANTSQKPRAVIDAMTDHLTNHNANVARAVHQLGAESTAAYEAARDKVAAFINAPSRDEVVFTKNITEALNLLARVLGDAPGSRGVHAGDEILISEMEHHSNIVPWQLLRDRTGATLRWFGLTDEGRLDLSNIDELINERTKVVSLVWVSNMLGHGQPDRGDRPARSRGRSAGHRRRCPGRTAAAGGRLRPGRRLRRLHRSQGGRPDRHRSAVGTRRHLRGASAVPRWRRDDRDRDDAAVDVRRPAAPLRSRHAAHRGGRRARCSRGLPLVVRHGRRSPPTTSRSRRTPSSGSPTSAG